VSPSSVPRFCPADHQRLIRFAVFWSEARDDGTEIGAIELGIFGDFASEEAPAERAEWNEPDP